MREQSLGTKFLLYFTCTKCEAKQPFFRNVVFFFILRGDIPYNLSIEKVHQWLSLT